uniref:Uncharacterized protein n=1 Tax=uncultured Armatimonadetes bacterium TaxID=157466 RepID=A0A6J4IZW7_9BACT|nr:hypothetical protein AVDCRST_MAG63-2583 [uncultured Armatimonadetes bacterium]
MLTKRFVWSDPAVQQRLAARFVPAVHDEALGSASTPDVAMLRRVKAQSGARGGPTGQGCYAVTPAGTLLASASSATEPAKIADMLDEAWSRWQELSRQERRGADAALTPIALPDYAAQRKYPADGLVLRSFARFLPHPGVPDPWQEYLDADYAWFWKDEARAFVPDAAPLVRGARRDVPGELVERLARFHLHGPFAKDEVAEAWLTSEVADVAKDGLVTLRLRGATKTVRRERGNDKAGVGSVGVAASLAGRASWDPARQKFVAFELLGVGERRGAPQFWNLGEKGKGPWPVGFALTLAPDTPVVRQTAPFYYWGYRTPERPGY